MSIVVKNLPELPEIRIFRIIGGPNKDLLFDACKYANARNARFTVRFTVAAGVTDAEDGAYVPISVKNFVITGIEHEDGSGEKFNIKGFCEADFNDGTTGFKGYGFKAFYDTKKRLGTISFR